MKYVSLGVFGLFILSLINPSVSYAEDAKVGVISINPVSSFCLVIDTDLGFGSTDKTENGSVIFLQAFLHSKGYFKHEPTGYFGAITRQAVKEFQKDNGIAQTGFAGKLTRAKMKELTCGVEVSVMTDKAEYKKGEDIGIRIRATNTSEDPVKLKFSSGCEITYKIDSAYDFGTRHGCTADLGSRTVEGEKSYSWLVTHRSKDFEVATGTHIITGTLLNYGSATTSINVVE